MLKVSNTSEIPLKIILFLLTAILTRLAISEVTFIEIVSDLLLVAFNRKYNYCKIIYEYDFLNY